MTEDTCKHEWIAYGTALVPPTIMVHCQVCGEWGGVLQPTEEEWALAYHAPSRPYRWADGSKVVLEADLPEPTQEQLDMLSRFLKGEQW